jgi:hygromycin-B 7''-O-kinase
VRVEYREFTTVAEYEKVLLDVDYWCRYVDAAIRQIGLQPATKIKSPRQGSNVVFLVDDSYFVKIFTPVLNGRQQQGIEKLALEILDDYPEVLAPKLIGSGSLFPDRDWPWDFVVTRRLPGRTLDHLWDGLETSQREAVARDIGKYLRALHSIPVPGVLRDLISLRMGPEDFLVKWVCDVRARSLRFGIPKHLAEQAPAFVERWLPNPEQTAILHGDLTGEHMFGLVGQSRWTTTGFIDYGDLKLGNPLYDLVAIHFGIFLADTKLLGILFESYGDMPVYEANAMMALALVHEWDVLRELFQEDRVLASTTSLESVAEILWKP